MTTPNRKLEKASRDALAKRLMRKAKQIVLLREILPEHIANDPGARHRVLRGNRRKAKWNPPREKKKRKSR